MFKDEFIQVPGNTINANLTAGTYTLATCDNNNFDTNIYIKLFDKNSSVITTDGHLTVPSGQNMTFSKTSYSYWGASNYSYLTFTIDDDYKINIGLLNTDGTRQVMLLKGSLVERTYTPHKEQTFIFPLGNEKLMLGDYLADDGIHHMRGQVVLDGTEPWQQYGNNVYFQDINRIHGKPTSGNIIGGFCTHTDVTTRTNMQYNSPSGVGLFVSNLISYWGLSEVSVNAWETWLSTHNITVEYELAEEVIVPYTSAQQEVYNQIKQTLSYEEQTNISSNQNALFSVEAYQSTKLVLEENNAKYESLEARVALLE